MSELCNDGGRAVPRRKKPSGKGRGAWRWDWKEDEKRSDWTIKKRLEPRYRAGTFSQTVLEDVSCNRYTNNTNHSHERHDAFTARPKNTRRRSTMRYFREYVSCCLSCTTSIRVSSRLWTIVRLMIRISSTRGSVLWKTYYGTLVLSTFKEIYCVCGIRGWYPVEKLRVIGYRR